MFNSSNVSVASLQVTRGRFGRRVYRDPRFDFRHECRDCRGSGRCPVSEQPEGCLTCSGSGVVDTSGERVR